MERFLHVYFFLKQIGINLTDDMYNGRYNGRKHHEGDLDGVIERAKNMGCLKMMVTGSNVKESRHAINIAKAHRE